MKTHTSTSFKDMWEATTKELKVSTLCESDYSFEGNEKAFLGLPDDARNFFEDDRFGQLQQHLIEDKGEYDNFYIFGEVFNQFISTFPHLCEGWDDLSPNQKWIFIEGIFYGCHSLFQPQGG